MFTAKPVLLSSSGFVSFREKNKIHKEEYFSFPFIEFNNVPLSGWKLVKGSQKLSFANHYTSECVKLVHPENDKISFLFSNYFDFFDKLHIINGVIQNKIIILNDSYQASIAVEGTKEYDIALETIDNVLTNKKFTVKDLVPGSIVLFDTNFKHRDGFLYLGSYFLAESKTYYSQDNVSILNSKKSHIFLSLTEDTDIPFIFGSSSLKNLHMLDFVDGLSNIDFPSVLNKKVFYFDHPLFKKINNRIFFNEHSSFLVSSVNDIDIFLKLAKDRFPKRNPSSKDKNSGSTSYLF